MKGIATVGHGVPILSRAAPGGLAYWRWIKTLFGSALIGYWPLWELSGSAASDASGNGRNGTYNSVTLANRLAPGRMLSPLFGTSCVNIYSASLAAAWNGGSFSIALWAYHAAWRNATDAVMLGLFSDSNNYIYVDKLNSGGKGIARFGMKSGGSSGTIYDAALADDQGWIHVAVSFVSGSEYAMYLNGARLAAQFTGSNPPPAWTGSGLSATYSTIGANNTSYQKPWVGNLADVVILNRALTAGEAWQLYARAVGGIRLVVLGDSIAHRTDQNWTSFVQRDCGPMGIVSHAAAGATVVSQLAGQVAASASDDADKIIIALGTNDDNAGNMTTLQATYEAGITALKASNPKAQIIAMNVLPKWTDSGGGTPVDKSNIRTAIAAACTAQSVTCWDTFTDPWITAGQTSDGTHPTAAGHAAIATRVAGLL